MLRHHDAGQLPEMALIRRFSFPALKPNAYVMSCQCHVEPQADPSPSAAHPGSLSETNERPFYCSSESAILIIAMSLRLSESSELRRVSVSVVVHRQSLLDFLPKLDDSKDVPTLLEVPYEDWGIRFTSWSLDVSPWITTTAGQLHTRIKQGAFDDEGSSENSPLKNLQVLDFNPLSVRMAMACHEELGKTGIDTERRVITGRRRLPILDHFYDGARGPEFELPYILSSRPLPYTFLPEDVWMDEQRLVVLRVRFMFSRIDMTSKHLHRKTLLHTA